MALLDQIITVTPQHNRKRRGGTLPSGTFVIHTAENKTDKQGADSGDQSVLSWIKQRPDYGSYHSLVDSDSTLILAENESEPFHCTQTNRWSIGLSAAVASADWPELYTIPLGTFDRGHTIIDRMAAEAARRMKLLKAKYGIEVPIKHISRAEALARKPGFLGHGETDPARRTDPGKAFDWDFFLDRVNHHYNAASTAPAAPAANPQPKPLTLLEKVIKHMNATHIIFEANGALYIANILAGTYTKAGSPEELSARKTVLERAGAIVKEWKDFKSSKSDSKADPHAFGVEVTK